MDRIVTLMEQILSETPQIISQSLLQATRCPEGKVLVWISHSQSYGTRGRSWGQHYVLVPWFSPSRVPIRAGAPYICSSFMNPLTWQWIICTPLLLRVYSPGRLYTLPSAGNVNWINVHNESLTSLTESLKLVLLYLCDHIQFFK